MGGGTAATGVTATLDPAALKGELHFRTAKPGDVLGVEGGGTKKVGDLFSAARLSPLARKRLPIVCDLVGPVWIPGVRVAARVASKDGLVMRFGPLSDANGHNQ